MFEIKLDENNNSSPYINLNIDYDNFFELKKQLIIYNFNKTEINIDDNKFDFHFNNFNNLIDYKLYKNNIIQFILISNELKILNNNKYLLCLLYLINTEKIENNILDNIKIIINRILLVIINNNEIDINILFSLGKIYKYYKINNNNNNNNIIFNYINYFILKKNNEFSNDSSLYDGSLYNKIIIIQKIYYNINLSKNFSIFKDNNCVNEKIENIDIKILFDLHKIYKNEIKYLINLYEIYNLDSIKNLNKNEIIDNKKILSIFLNHIYSKHKNNIDNNIDNDNIIKFNDIIKYIINNVDCSIFEKDTDLYKYCDDMTKKNYFYFI